MSEEVTRRAAEDAAEAAELAAKAAREAAEAVREALNTPPQPVGPSPGDSPPKLRSPVSAPNLGDGAISKPTPYSPTRGTDIENEWGEGEGTL
jgi:hypothetical protein